MQDSVTLKQHLASNIFNFNKVAVILVFGDYVC